MKLTVAQHVPYEGPGALTAWVEARGHSIYTYESSGYPHHWPEPAPELNLIVLGGPMGAYETERYPWLKQEQELMSGTLRAGGRVLGICLGAQQLAVCLGGQVSPGQPELGWWPLQLAERSLPYPNLAWPPDLTPLHWHADHIYLPAHCPAHLHYRTEAGPVQVFTAAKGRGLGLQFHLEATEAWLKEMLAHTPEASYPQGPHVQTPDELLQHLSAHAARNEALLFQLLDAWAAC